MTVYTNLVPNPQPISGTGWGNINGTGGTATITLPTSAGGPAGNNARRQTWTAAPSNYSTGQWVGSTALPIPVTPGATYSVAIYVRTSKDQRLRLAVQHWDTTSYATSLLLSSSAEVVVLANTWTEMKFEGIVADAGATAMRLRVDNIAGTSGSLWAIGDWLEVQASTVVESATIPFPFHGDLTDTSSYTFDWTGTADASTSTATTVTSTIAVPTWIEPGVTTLTSSSSALAWNAASGAATYDIERDGIVIVQSHPSTTYTDLAGGPGKAYRVRGVG